MKFSSVAQIENNLAHVSIQDQGIGIPAHALEQIFAPYYRVEAESSRYITGTGLGLSIVRQIIEMHSGKVWVESTHGARFNVSFYLATLSGVRIASLLDKKVSERDLIPCDHP